MLYSLIMSLICVCIVETEENESTDMRDDYNAPVHAPFTALCCSSCNGLSWHLHGRTNHQHIVEVHLNHKRYNVFIVIVAKVIL